jgi:microcystin-dependent protein
MATGLPAGTIISYVGANLNSPDLDKWVPCDGRPVLVKDYPKLAGVLGTTFGVDAQGNPNAPDLRGMFVRGVDQGRKMDPDAASRFGPGDPSNPSKQVGDVVGSYQMDTVRSGVIQPQVHELMCMAGDNMGFSCVQDVQTLNPPGGADANFPQGPDWFNETRPRNVSVYFLIYAGD